MGMKNIKGEHRHGSKKILAALTMHANMLSA